MRKQMSLRKTTKFALGVIIPAFIISAYLIFRTSNVAAYNNFCRNVVLSNHLTDIEFLDISPETLQKGYFTASFTFENPTDQTVNITSLSAVLFPTSPSVFPLAIGQGSIKGPVMLGTGKTQIALQMSLTKNASPTVPSYWNTNHSLKFGSVHYSFNSSTEPIPGLPSLRTYGPYSLGENTALTQATTYSVLAIDAWAIGLEALAVFILIQGRKANKTMLVETKNEHNKMAATIYALQGITILVFPQLTLFLQNSVTPTPPPEFSYGGHGAAGVLSDILRGAYYLFGLILLVISLSLFLRLSATKSTVYYLSWIMAAIEGTVGIMITASFLVNQLFWSSSTELSLTLGTLILILTFSNILVVYILSRKTWQPDSAQNATYRPNAQKS